MTIYFMKILLDTSVVGAYYDNRQPERMALTKEFWKVLKNFQVYISEITIEEINQITNKILKKKYLKLIKPFKALRVINEIKSLAQVYLDVKIIPKEYINDALLIATTSVYNLDILVSWNFKHMVNLRVKTKVNAINTLYNFPTINIVSPGELL